MKKIIALFLIIITGASTVTVNAMTKEELKNKLFATYDLNGHELRASEDYKVQFERYLNQNELSESDMDYIAEKFDEAIKILQSENISSLEEITISQKSKLIPLINDVTNRTSVKATVAKNTVIIYNQDGTEFTRVTFLVKQTGHSNLYFICALGVVVLGTIIIARKMKKINA